MGRRAGRRVLGAEDVRAIALSVIGFILFSAGVALVFNDLSFLGVAATILGTAVLFGPQFFVERRKHAYLATTPTRAWGMFAVGVVLLAPGFALLDLTSGPWDLLGSAVMASAALLMGNTDWHLLWGIRERQGRD